MLPTSMPCHILLENSSALRGWRVSLASVHLEYVRRGVAAEHGACRGETCRSHRSFDRDHVELAHEVGQRLGRGSDTGANHCPHVVAAVPRDWAETDDGCSRCARFEGREAAGILDDRVGGGEEGR